MWDICSFHLAFRWLFCFLNFFVKREEFLIVIKDFFIGLIRTRFWVFTLLKRWFKYLWKWGKTLKIDICSLLLVGSHPCCIVDFPLFRIAQSLVGPTQNNNVVNEFVISTYSFIAKYFFLASFALLTSGWYIFASLKNYLLMSSWEQLCSISNTS